MGSVTGTILMIRPVKFRLNEQTVVNNYYQKIIDGLTSEEIQRNAATEFDQFAAKLHAKDIEVIVIDDTITPDTPDSIFPNNWVSFHSDGRVGLYPMYAVNRRQERRMDILETLQDEYHMKVSNVVDFTNSEKNDKFLEGTGSMVLDRAGRIAYAAISKRTDEAVLATFCDEFNYSPVTFTAYQPVNGARLPIYHTNVMMCVGDSFAVLCADCIDDLSERSNVIQSLENSGKEIIYISEEQVQRFAGNMLQLHARSDSERKYLVMSESAFLSLHEAQKSQISKHCEIIYSSLNTIEALGGGSARCMMAEVFLPKEN